MLSSHGLIRSGATTVRLTWIRWRCVTDDECLRDGCDNERADDRGSLGRFCSTECLTEYRRNRDPSLRDSLENVLRRDE